MTRYYSRYDLIREALDRLSLLHSSDYRIVSGKNKLTFELNGEYFEVFKSIDKTMNKCKTIVEGCDNNMIPIILYQSENDLFTDKDVEEMVCGLDNFFISERIRHNPSFAICNRYYYLSDFLAKYSYDLETLFGEAQSDNFISKEDNSIILMFKAYDNCSDFTYIIFFVIEDYQLNILVFDYNIENSIVYLDDIEIKSSLLIEYANKDKEEISAAADQFLARFNKLVPYKGKYTYLKKEQP